jgi:hypothetical protein
MARRPVDTLTFLCSGPARAYALGECSTNNQHMILQACYVRIDIGLLITDQLLKVNIFVELSTLFTLYSFLGPGARLSSSSDCSDP